MASISTNLTKTQDTKAYDTFKITSNKLHPEQQATWWSYLFLSWCDPLLKLGQERSLKPGDTWELIDQNKCEVCSKELIARWDGKNSLARALNSVYGFRYYLVGIMLLGAYGCDFFGPIVLKVIVDTIKSPDLDINTIWMWLGLLFVSRIIKSLLFAHFYYQTQIIMLRFTSAMKGFVFRKALSLSAKARAEKSTGDIVNIYTSDVQNIISAAFYLHYMWVLPIEIAAALYMLTSVVGRATFAGVGTIIIVLIMNNIIAKLQVTYFDKIMKIKDERMKCVNEIFSAIQIVKLNAWERKFSEKLGGIRTRELIEIWRYMRLGAINIFILWGAPIFVSAVTFAVYVVVMKQELTAGKVFTAIALFRLLQEPLRSLPQYVTGLIQAGVSLKRLKEFSSLEERDPTNVIRPGDSESKEFIDETVAVEIRNAVFTWDPSSSTSLFQNLNLKVKTGQFIVIHGRVGSGKSSFCSLLLGDMVKVSGQVFVGGSVAYCPQQPWIQNMTIKENILFGSSWDPKKYKKVIEACGLAKDIKLFPAGDETEIGEKGLNVSGGQKARISLARACYSDADIFIMDCPLAAVDAIVQNEIFNKCLLSLLHNKTRILVTHNQEIINSPHIDRDIEIGPGKFIDVHNESKQSVTNFFISPLPSRFHKKSKSLPLVRQLSDAERQPCPGSSSVIAEGFTPLDKRTSSFFESQGIGKSTGLTTDETRESGRVSKRVFLSYLKAVGGMKVVLTLIMVQTMWQILQIGSDFWLSYWTTQSNKQQQDMATWNIFVYALLAVGGSLMVFARSYTISYSGVQGARQMYDQMTSALMKAPMFFFDSNPTGRILNRMSDDQSNIDFRLPFAFGSLMGVGFSVVATLCTAAVVTRFLGFLLLPLIYLYFRIGTYYLTTARDLQRLQKTTQSPVLSLVSETVEGVYVIRSFGQNHVERFIARNESVIDTNNSNQFAAFAVSEWFAMRMQLMGGAILLIVTVSLTIVRDYLSAGIVGLAFNYALAVDHGLESVIQIWSYLETSMVSPERIQEYIDIPSEAPHVISETEPPSSWPDVGEVEFDNVSFSYKEGGNLVLRNLSLKIKGGEKIGIVGRTGAGKSSMTLCLFRINEVNEGCIKIDGVDVSKLGLNTLRGRLSIVTQTPVLFKGTIRSYIDPFDEYTDENIWSTLRKVELASSISKLEGKLDAPLEENGENFSVGERQMLCMGRALLSTSKVVVMDEATASVDHETDVLLQSVIRGEFKKSTVITIAHRLDTILDADRVIVLDAGKIVQFDSPKALIALGKGHFYDLAKEGGYLNRM